MNLYFNANTLCSCMMMLIALTDAQKSLVCQDGIPSTSNPTCFTVSSNANEAINQCSNSQTCVVAALFYVLQADDEISVDLYVLRPTASTPLIRGVWASLYISPDSTRINKYIKLHCSRFLAEFNSFEDVEQVTATTDRTLIPSSIMCTFEIRANLSAQQRNIKSFDLRNQHHLMLEYGHVGQNGATVLVGNTSSNSSYKFAAGNGAWTSSTSTSTTNPIDGVTLEPVSLSRSNTIGSIATIVAIILIVIVVLLTVTFGYLYRVEKNKAIGEEFTVDSAINTTVTADSTLKSVESSKDDY